MKGDFTRGFNPDSKRGQTYRRVMLQQGRALLDSDTTALVDALDNALRHNLRMTGCRAGTPDLGLLVTPGQLLAQFDGTLGNDVEVAGGANAVRDYSRKYLDRLPGLRIGGSGGTVTVGLVTPLSTPTAIRIWARADNGGATLQVNGIAVNVPSGAAYEAVDLTTAGGELVVTIDPAARVWMALIETRADAGLTPVLHSHAGNYEVEGLPFVTDGGAWPTLADPAGAVLINDAQSPPGTRLLAYVEVWEQLVTSVEDPGIREVALGGDLDTTTRTQVRHQVKLAEINGIANDQVAAAFLRTQLPTGTVTLGVANETTTADPCDLPVPGGYTGPENRLYRLEVHGPADGGGTLFKWSRVNGSELFAAAFPDTLVIPAPASSIVVQAESDLRDGDLVELLSDAIDFGDDAPGVLDAAGFRRPRRAAGRLLRIAGGENVSGSTRTFDLLDPIDETPVTDVDTGRFGAAGLKLRRWSGLLQQVADGVLELEQGIEADIAGSFEPGDWWQYEARVGAANANGPARPTPHGPEREFAPLAVLRQTPASEPVLLDAWLDTRFPRLCEIEADDIAYDGARVDTEADTVQEALDELFERETGGGCGEIFVPEGGDIRDVIDAIPDGGDAKICLGPGTRVVPSAVQIFNKGHITITGIGLGTLLDSPRATLHFRNCRAVTLVDFSIRALGNIGSVVLIEDCNSVDIDRLVIESSADVEPPAAAIRLQARSEGRIARASITDCRLRLGLNDTGILAIGVLDFAATGNDIRVVSEPFDVAARLADNRFASIVGRVFLNQLSFNVDSENFVGSAHVNLPSGERWRRGIALAGWGQDALRFTTHAVLESFTWDAIAQANPPGNSSGGPPSMRAHIRRVRRGVARFALNEPTSVTIPSTVEGILRNVGQGIAASASRTYGHAGIIVAAPRGPQVAGNVNPSGLHYSDDAQTARIDNNRIAGFHQGIRVGGDRRTGGTDTMRTVFRDVAIDGNRIDLIVPMYARSCWGIAVGSAISVAVRNNRVATPFAESMPVPDPPAVSPQSPTDGVRLWGIFGAFVQLERNACFGTSQGVRLRALNAQDDPARMAWKVSDFGGDEPVPANSLAGSFGDAEIVSVP